MRVDLRADLFAGALLPGLVASVVTYLVYGAVDGFVPVFGDQGAITFTGAGQFVWFAVLGVAAGLLALGLERDRGTGDAKAEWGGEQGGRAC